MIWWWWWYLWREINNGEKEKWKGRHICAYVHTSVVMYEKSVNMHTDVHVSIFIYVYTVSLSLSSPPLSLSPSLSLSACAHTSAWISVCRCACVASRPKNVKHLYESRVKIIDRTIKRFFFSQGQIFLIWNSLCYFGIPLPIPYLLYLPPTKKKFLQHRLYLLVSLFNGILNLHGLFNVKAILT